MIRQYCIDKSLDIAQQLFPQDYAKSGGQRTYHYAFGYIGKKLIGIGLNEPHIQDAKAMYFGRRFNVEQFQKHPFKHAEIALLSKLWGKTHIDGKLSIYVIRINKFGIQYNSKPCKNCQTILDALGITDVYWTPFPLTKTL